MSGSDADWSNTPRLFVESALAPGAPATVPAHYLVHVLRRRVADPIRLFNGADGEWGAQIASAGKREAMLTADLLLRPQAPEPDFWLVFAPLRRELTELVVQKATELGVSEIHFVKTARTQPFRLNLDRLHAIAVEAAEQSERLTLPTLREPVKLASLLAAWPRERLLAVALERYAGETCREAGGVLIGPEGGFTPEERAALMRAECARPMSLGPNVLRAETAAIVGVSKLVHF